MKTSLEDRLRQDAVLSRTGASHAKAAAWTPEAIKLLRPTITGEMRVDTPLGCVLAWQPSLRMFQAYYPRTHAAMNSRDKTKKIVSTGKTYADGEVGGVSQLTALWHCVQFLWRQHDALGRSQDGKPTKAGHFIPAAFICFEKRA